jgi:hypothetical protein
MGAASGSIVRRRKSARPDPVDRVDQADLLDEHDLMAAVQADVREVVATMAVVKVGLPVGRLHLRAIATAERRQVRDDLVVRGPVAMLVPATVERGEILAAMIGEGVGATATVVNADAGVQPRARAAVVVAVDVVVAAAAKITTKCRPPAASSTTSTTGTSVVGYFSSQSG